MIPGCVVYRCHVNIDFFSKITIIINFNPNGSKWCKFYVDSLKESLLKSRLKILDMALKKKVSKHLKVLRYCFLRAIPKFFKHFK